MFYKIIELFCCKQTKESKKTIVKKLTLDVDLQKLYNFYIQALKDGK